MSDELRHRVAASGATNVTFEGFVGDMDAVYRRSHVLLLLSATEGTPRVVLEAMARGVVVIATAVGGVPSLIADGVTGFLVDPAPESVVTDVVARLDGLARDPDGSARITAAARESVLARFSIEAMHRLTADAYGEAMARRFTSRGRLLAAGRRRGRRRAN
jgi:glycosyltransferase involved in cell wall biosynthesis